VGIDLCEAVDTNSNWHLFGSEAELMDLSDEEYCFDRWSDGSGQHLPMHMNVSDDIHVIRNLRRMGKDQRTGLGMDYVISGR
jgi:hypothetical protein